MSTTIMIKKRDGREVEFDADKIVCAIYGAFTDIGRPIDSYATRRANAIAAYIRERAEESDAPLGVEEIQDLVEKGLMGGGTKDVARQYISYRNARTMARETPIDSAIMELLDGESEYWNRENSNKNAKWVTTQRDYMAGIVSKHIARKYIFPEDAIKAHEQGIIHIHDMDYVAQHTLHNCELINLNDMLQNGTVVNGVLIERPHRILTATTIATQIIAAVASSSYGGATITLTHLAPFVRESHDRYFEKYKSWGVNDEKAEEFAQRDLKKEVRDAVQTLTYQLNSLTTTNGQSPFISVMMYMNETNEYKPELAMLIEEVLRQRIEGLKNRKGVPVTPAFPF